MFREMFNSSVGDASVMFQMVIRCYPGGHRQGKYVNTEYLRPYTGEKALVDGYTVVPYTESL